VADNEDLSRQLVNIRRKLQRGNQDMADLRLHLEEQVGRNAELEKKQRKWVNWIYKLYFFDKISSAFSFIPYSFSVLSEEKL